MPDVAVTTPDEISTVPSVETPETFTSSSSVCPSTSKSPLASIAPAKVETPETFTSSSSVCPSTSIEALISTLDPKVDKEKVGVKYDSAGQPSISKPEIISLYKKWKKQLT